MRLVCIVALLAAVAVARPVVCTVHPADQHADFHTINAAIAGCGKGAAAEVKLIVMSGAFHEGLIRVPEHLSYLSIVSSERNLDLVGGPRIVGAFELSAPIALELSHLVLDGANTHPMVVYQTDATGAPAALKSFLVLGCRVRGYTMPPYVSADRGAFVAGTAVEGVPDPSEHTPSLAMPFPWTLQRAAAYADEKK